MYLKCNHRVKDGKEHRYWNILEKRRCAGGRIVERQVLYLGEINDSQKAAWEKCIEVFDDDQGEQTRLALYPDDRPIPAHAAEYGVQIRLREFTLRRPRQWGACWVFCRCGGNCSWTNFGRDDWGKAVKAPRGIRCCWCWRPIG